MLINVLQECNIRKNNADKPIAKNLFEQAPAHK